MSLMFCAAECTGLPYGLPRAALRRAAAADAATGAPPPVAQGQPGLRPPRNAVNIRPRMADAGRDERSQNKKKVQDAARQPAERTRPQEATRAAGWPATRTPLRAVAAAVSRSNAPAQLQDLADRRNLIASMRTIRRLRNGPGPGGDAPTPSDPGGALAKTTGASPE